MKTITNKSKTILLTQIISIAMTTLLAVPTVYAKEPTLKKGFNGDLTPRVQTPLPDFYMNSVSNAHQSGPKGIFKYGVCSTSLKAHMKNFGAKYQYGYTYFRLRQSVSAGQVFVRFDINKRNGSLVSQTYSTSINSWDANQTKTAVGNSLQFPKKGHYRLTATIIACAKGNNNPSNCKRFPEEGRYKNSTSVDVYVNHKC